jgi:hypothetical protein
MCGQVFCVCTGVGISRYTHQMILRRQILRPCRLHKVKRGAHIHNPLFSKTGHSIIHARTLTVCQQRLVSLVVYVYSIIILHSNTSTHWVEYVLVHNNMIMQAQKVEPDEIGAGGGGQIRNGHL